MTLGGVLDPLKHRDDIMTKSVTMRNVSLWLLWATSTTAQNAYDFVRMVSFVDGNGGHADDTKRSLSGAALPV